MTGMFMGVFILVGSTWAWMGLVLWNLWCSPIKEWRRKKKLSKSAERRALEEDGQKRKQIRYENDMGLKIQEAEEKQVEVDELNKQVVGVTTKYL